MIDNGIGNQLKSPLNSLHTAVQTWEHLDCEGAKEPSCWCASLVEVDQIDNDCLGTNLKRPACCSKTRNPSLLRHRQ
jgi:hypothetical protein